MDYTDKPTTDQLRIAALLGVEIAGDTASVAAARIMYFVRPAVAPGHSTQVVSDGQLVFASSLGLTLTKGTSVGVAGAMIADELGRRNAEALATLALVPGDRVKLRDPGNPGTADEYVVSSIGKDRRVYFRGGGGRGAWPTAIERA